MSEKSAKSAFTVFAMITATLFAKALGLFRSMLLAWTLGDLPEAVAFAAASKIPGALFDLFFSAAISGTFIPLYGEARCKNEKSAFEFARAFFGACLLAAVFLSLSGAVFAPKIVALSAPKLVGESSALCARLLRIMFPATVFAAAVYTFSGIMQSHGSFILPAAVSAASNLFIIFYLMLAGARFSVYALAAAYVFSWALQFFVLAVPLAAKKRFPLPQIKPKNELLRKAFARAPRIMAASWLAPASALFAAFFCSFVSGSAIVLYDYASGIYTIISGIAVYGVGNYVFPALSKIHAQGNASLFARETERAVFCAIALMLPVFCAATVLAGEGVALLYAHGNFSMDAAKGCAEALRVLSAAMPAFAVSEILYRAFCAAGKTKTLARASLAAICTSLASNALSLLCGGGLFGVCASFAAAQWVYALLLLFSAKKLFRGVYTAKDLKKYVRLALGGALCFSAMALLAQNFPFFSQLSPYILNFLKITIVFTTGIVIYLLYMYFTGLLRPISKKKEKR